MELLEQIWESLSSFFGGLLSGFERFITALFGSSNARFVKKLQTRVDAITALEEKYKSMSDAELKEQTKLFKQRLASGETLEDILEEAFAVCREGGRRFMGMRHYDVQLIGGMVLHSGTIAEMITGEGKTLVATLPAYLNALEGKGVHVVTVNDYLARRDMEWMSPIYRGLGLTVDAIQSDMEPDRRQKAYSCDITYGTNNEFGFDYLRDNMKPAARGDDRFPKQQQQAQGRLHFAIIDEVDNILIDEARTPLIISGPSNQGKEKYSNADRISAALKKDIHFEVNEKDRSTNLTEEGVREAEKLAGVESFYTAGNMEWPHLLDNALKARYLYQRDVDYVVENKEVIIIDVHTGRKMEGRQWSDGLHQAVQARENLPIKEETQTLATITLQNFFKLYNKICGMTGTAMTEANELWKIYKLDVVAIPTNRDMQRIAYPDVIYMTEAEKYEAVADEIEQMHKWDLLEMKSGEDKLGTIVKDDEEVLTFEPAGKKGKENIPRETVKHVQGKARPILIGTVSIEKSERLSRLLQRRGIKHELLNAKQHQREADIVAQAGRIGAVTISTSMAGRGTDIILGGNPETMAWSQLQNKYENRLEVPQEEWDTLVNEIEQREGMKAEGEVVRKLGGLHVIATERHESRRIDLQLRGRCGRQGDPGSSKFYLSLEDDLMRIFFGDWVKKWLTSIGGMEKGDSINSPMVARRVEGAQKKIEERNFDIRKNLLEYDEVMDEQRKRIYGFRQRILEGADSKDLIMEMIEDQVYLFVDKLLDKQYSLETFASYAGHELKCELEPKDFRGLEINAATRLAKEEAEKSADSAIMASIDENLPEEEDPSEWNWQAMARFANSMWNLGIKDRKLIQLGRDKVDEFLVEKSREFIEKVDLSDGEKFLDPDFGIKSLCGWANYKFGFKIDPEEFRNQSKDFINEYLIEKANELYNQKESKYPVLTGLYKFSQKSGSHAKLDRDALVHWAQSRFETSVSLEDLKSKQREEIQGILEHESQKHKSEAESKLSKVREKVATLYEDNKDTQTLAVISGGNGQLNSLSDWIKTTINQEVDPEELAPLDREQLETRLIREVNERYRPEMTRMERSVLLELVDTSWKDHLLAMDHLRSAVSFVGYAQVDAKVEYKREGMRLFEQMWDSIGERVTDLVFKMESLNEEFVSSTWIATEARHDAAPSTNEMASQQEQAIANSQQSGEQKIETIRNKGEKVRRNDPCPCGSGKKYKVCCMRK